MIYYSDHRFQLSVIFMAHGSVLPQAFTWAFGNAVLAMVLHWFLRSGIIEWHPVLQPTGAQVIWGGYTAVLGFLVVFRNNQAYARFWEGATSVIVVLLMVVVVVVLAAIVVAVVVPLPPPPSPSSLWFNAVSSLMAFCNTNAEMKREVDHFQNLMIRLASLLHCSALQEVCEIEDANLEILDCSNIDQESLYFLEKVHDRCEIIMSWIQRLIMKAHLAHIIIAPPPILSRSFQELSRGVVNLNNVRKIRDIPFPFPYNQVLIAMLAVHWIITPMLAASVVESTAWAGLMCFFVTGCLWAVIYIAKEIDQPFGEDPNDLPMVAMQRDFNRSLLNLMHPRAQMIPVFHHEKERKLTITGRYSGMSFPDSHKGDNASDCSDSHKPPVIKQGRRSVRLDGAEIDPSVVALELIPEEQEQETKADMGNPNARAGGFFRQHSSSSDASSSRRQRMIDAGLPGEWPRQISSASGASSVIASIPRTDADGRRNLNRASGYGMPTSVLGHSEPSESRTASWAAGGFDAQPSEIRCHGCRQAVHADWRYCTTCGHGRPICSCGTILQPETNVCHQCGREANEDSADGDDEPPPEPPHKSKPCCCQEQQDQIEFEDSGMFV
eukprot:TRINITY_DN6806_c0_g1_i2.p1 TRINITY_DN6806_c0_g1~~TRINITY_DN6806_c0_g1_i2.p1  ORF type:complete len:610 (-),score=92.33 TRINITY_DN6806_c0_g1_i2:197-2026(-)